jgi:hypothetical protein
MTKEEIINETVEYYKDESKRGYNAANEQCEYLTESGNMCAVGRCLIPGSLMESFFGEPRLAQSMRNCGLSVLDVANLEEILKPEYRGHSRNFWAQLQILHDCSDHFNDGTMNEVGLKHAKGLIESLRHVNDANI